jgi:hypothetical protein
MCCAGSICQADLDEDVNAVRTFQNQIDNAPNLIQTHRLLGSMVEISDHRDVDALLEGIFLSVQNEDGRKVIKLNTLRLLAFPDRCLSVTQLVREIRSINGVTNADIGTLLVRIKTRLNLDDDEDDGSPIVELSKRYN